MGAEANKKEVRTGDFFVNRGSGEVNLGNVLLFGVTLEKEILPVKSGKSNRAVDVKEWLQDMPLKVSMNDHTWENFQEIMGIDATTESPGTQAVTAEELLLTGVAWSSLDHGTGSESPITAVTVKGSGGTPTYIEDTDYSVDYPGARIRRITGGGISDPSTVEVDYSYVTLTAKKIKVSKNQVDTQAAVRYSHALANGETLEIKLYNAYVSEDIEVQHTMDGGLAEWTVTWRAMQVDAQTGEELGYIRFTA